jgi:hypothetical protein
MLNNVPEGASASEAQDPPFVGPMSVVVIFLPLTSIAHSSAWPVEKEKEVV